MGKNWKNYKKITKFRKNSNVKICEQKKIRIRIENKNNHSFKVQKKERNSIVSFYLIVFVVISFLVSLSV